jgi:glycosyltransferase involved in cell wall biosynthesis
MRHCPHVIFPTDRCTDYCYGVFGEEMPKPVEMTDTKQEVEIKTRKLKVLWCGDAGVNSGFGIITRHVCDYLHSQGHEIHVLALNYFGPTGKPNDTQPYPLYTCAHPWDGGHDSFGSSRLPVLIDRLRPDVVIILNDTFNMWMYVEDLKRYYSDPTTSYNSHKWTSAQLGGDPASASSTEWVGYCADCGVEHMGDPREMDGASGGDDLHYPHCCISTPIIPWLAVDSKNQHATILNHPYISHVATWTEFGARELVSGGYTGGECGNPSISIIPLGVDTSIFYPRDKSTSRALTCRDLSLPPDAFIVGYVGRNQYRKRLDLLILIFSAWIKRYSISNAWLYLHIGPTGDQGVDVESLVRYYGLNAETGVDDSGQPTHPIPGTGRVIISSPEIGHGVDTREMPLIYSSFDVFMSTSQAEGWNLPALEAMACGVPCVLPDQGSTGWDGGWCIVNGESAVVLIDCPTPAMTAPVNSRMHTIGGVVDVESGVAGLQEIYMTRDDVKSVAEAEFYGRGLKLAQSLTWDITAKEFESMLMKVLRVETTSTDNTIDMCSLCSKPAICVSGNIDALVCEDCFMITNGTTADVSDRDESELTPYEFWDRNCYPSEN